MWKCGNDLLSHLSAVSSRQGRVRNGPADGALRGMSKAMPNVRPARRDVRTPAVYRRTPRDGKSPHQAVSPGVGRARRKFLKVFPQGFRDATYLDWERGYKEKAHEQWQAVLDKPTFRR